ncbi:MAG TPA: hypothetical protein VME63_06445 [Dyella sp.]|uniref:hypothetical protein n=1 Tax=Dyella sp. TaxID=1869338 RepID=UPI002CBB0D99|nr:hypothetical protein [Dyella sp.]HTV85023.1 hypothetical protein [Dyella sp.]
MAHVLLHIGSEKTGTTYLQHLLQANANVLRKKYGLLYPTDGLLLQQAAHHPIAAAFLPPERCDFIALSSRRPAALLMEHLNQVIARTHSERVLLSAEHMSSRFDREAIGELAGHLSQHSVQVIFYVRRQDELALSALSTDLCCGSRDWIPLERISPDVRRFNPLRIVEDWQAVFGRDAVTVRSYASACRNDLTRDFLDCIGLAHANFAEWEAVGRINQRISLYEARILHGINQFLPTWREAVQQGEPETYHQANHLRASLLAWLRAEDAVASDVPLDAALSPRQRMTLMQHFTDINRQLADACGLNAREFDMSGDNSADVAARMLKPEDECMLMAQVLRIVSQRLLHSQSHGSITRDAVRRIGAWSRRLIVH